MVRRASFVSVLALASVVFVASFGAAQTGSGIAGLVTDSSGAVLPGVTVEASSPALIEKFRTVVTDSQGVYSITDLRPGVYTVTFTLAGFSTVRREGIELTSSFTATVNVEMRVGALEEVVTVVGATPIVDIKNVVQQKAFTRDILEALPTGSKSWGAAAILIPGVVLSGAQNVGGTGASNATATIHGGSGAEAIMLLDGMRYHQGSGYGGVRNAYNENDGSIEELTFQTGALSAETEVGGFVRNIVPKEGGNTFRGFFGAAYTNHNLQSNNLDDALRNRGIAAVNFVDVIWDLNPAIGGPLARDRLWFYSAFRSWGVNQGIAGTFFNKTPTGLSYIPDLSRQALSTSRKGSENLRLTWMATPKNRVGIYYEYQQNQEDYSYGQGSLGGAGITSPEAITRYKVAPQYFVQASWRNIMSPRLLLDAGMTYVNADYKFYPQPGNPPDLPAIRELRTNTLWRNAIQSRPQHTHQFNIGGSLSYVTGSHTFKAGALFLRSDVFRTWDTPGNSTVLQLLDGRPTSVVVYAHPFAQLDEKLRAQVGIYAQDHWKIRRIALFLGMRFDSFNAFVPTQHLGPGPWVPTRDVTFAEVPNVPNWKDVTPRFGVAYDLFGTGKTAVKATLNRYLFGAEIITFTQAANPVAAIATSATRTWNDANGDFVPQVSELGPLSAATFGLPRITSRYDPEILNGWGKRGYNWEVTTGVDHEVLPKVGISVTYIHRWWRNLLVRQNQGVTAADFDPYCITAPVDPRLPGSGNQICGLYDVTAAKFGVINDVITFVKNFGNESLVYDGVDLSVSARLPNGALFGGGTNIGRTRDNFCYALNDPSLAATTVEFSPAGGTFVNGAPRTQAFCDIRPPFQPDIKFYGAHPLPWWGLQASATLQSRSGPQILASYTARNAEIVPTLGRNLASGPGGTAQVQLVPPATEYGDRLIQVDFRLSKTFNVARGRLQAQFDLYNLFNGNPIIAQNNTFGPNWQRPTVVQLGRLAKFGFQWDF